MAQIPNDTILKPSDGSGIDRANMAGVVRDDRIFPETRWIGACIPPFLVVAFIMLFFFPNDTATLFAWTIKPAMTPLLMGAGYELRAHFARLERWMDPASDLFLAGCLVAYLIRVARHRPAQPASRDAGNVDAA